MNRSEYHACTVADQKANRGYPKSILILRGFRLAQYLRSFDGMLGRLAYLLVGCCYKFTSEWFLGIELPASTKVGAGLRLRHGVGLVVNPHALIGQNVMLRHGATLGNRLASDDCPTLEDDVEVGVGAVIIGAITVGRGARIGPNAVVIKNVPAGAVVYSPPTYQK